MKLEFINLFRLGLYNYCLVFSYQARSSASHGLKTNAIALCNMLHPNLQMYYRKLLIGSIGTYYGKSIASIDIEIEMLMPSLNDTFAKKQQ